MFGKQGEYESFVARKNEWDRSLSGRGRSGGSIGSLSEANGVDIESSQRIHSNRSAKRVNPIQSIPINERHNQFEILSSVLHSCRSFNLEKMNATIKNERPREAGCEGFRTNFSKRRAFHFPFLWAEEYFSMTLAFYRIDTLSTPWVRKTVIPVSDRWLIQCLKPDL